MTSPCNHGNHWLLSMVIFYLYYGRLPPYQICSQSWVMARGQKRPGFFYGKRETI